MSEMEDHGESLHEMEDILGRVLGTVYDIWNSLGNYLTNTGTTEDPSEGPSTDGKYYSFIRSMVNMFSLVSLNSHVSCLMSHISRALSVSLVSHISPCLISLSRVSGVEPLSGDYCALSSDHTLCKYPVSVSIVNRQACIYLFQGPSDSCSTKTIYRELSEEAKQAILDMHNELRGRVARGEETGGINGPQPAAANMRKLVSRE